MIGAKVHTDSQGCGNIMTGWGKTNTILIIMQIVIILYSLGLIGCAEPNLDLQQCKKYADSNFEACNRIVSYLQNGLTEQGAVACYQQYSKDLTSCRETGHAYE
jgi:hypothetical protein